MRIFLVLLTAGSLGLPGLFAQTTIQVTPDSLGGSGWHVLGAPGGALKAGADGWTLPAGAQIFRMLTPAESASAVAVTLRAQPRFAVQAEETTVLELGDEALMFLRTDAGGQLLLFAGGKVSSSLPGLVPLDASGRSADLLTVQLGYDPDHRVYSASALGRTVALPAGANQQPPAEFALSTGTNSDLRIAALELEFTPPPAKASTRSGGAALSESAPATAEAAKSDPALEAAQQQQARLQRAMRLSLIGKFDAAWAALQENPDPSAKAAAEAGWRAATVVGFLKNQSRYAEAEQFAKVALSQPWCAAATDAGVRYWTAWIALEGLGDRSRALQALGEAGPADPAAAAPLRARVQASLQSFPGQ
ncbi:MAG: hypothetical protein PHE83_12790 [Opitutaceae bacterium]|nr:hypothetical protein [Opitutaceae bacterium]